MDEKTRTDQQLGHLSDHPERSHLAQLVQTQDPEEIPASPSTNTKAERQELQNTIDRLQQTMLTLDKQVSDTLIAKSVDRAPAKMVVRRSHRTDRTDQTLTWYRTWPSQ